MVRLRQSAALPAAGRAAWPAALSAGLVGLGSGRFVWVARRFVPGFTSVVAGYPGALVAAWHAQTGLLLGAVQAGVAVLLERCPFLAGICTGLLAYKPHLAVLFPVAFLAGDYAKVWQETNVLLEKLNPEQKAQILGGTAARFYRLGLH